MSIFNLNVNPYEMILIIIPTAIFVVSLLLEIVIKKKLMITIIVFFACLIAPFSLGLAGCGVYTVISYIGTIIGDLIVIVCSKIYSKLKKCEE